MASVKLPQMELTGDAIVFGQDNNPPEFQQINQSSLLAYLGIRGIARDKYNFPGDAVTLRKNAIPMLCYYDIAKNYYCNKMEEQAYVIEGDYPTITGTNYNGSPATGKVINAYTFLGVDGSNLTENNVEINFSRS